ncbi:MAG: hypothetical protein EOL97_02585 [Spirochaetia bacterium]|nr:hypothetical protein [Spirochaetia bacterium]
MEISKTDAVEIVKEISNLLHKKLNIMNNEGIIIASSDPSRINTFHEGAYKIINEKLIELEIQENDYDLKGSYIGLNFPIEINNEIIGVVGITGNSDETRAFGNIVKKMTEILIEGKIREENYRNKEKVREYFLIDWVSTNNTLFNSQLIQRGLEFNIDVQKQRRIVCMDISIIEKDKILMLEKRIKNKLLSYDSSNLIFRESNSIVLVTQELNREKINTQLNSIINLSKKDNAKVFFGISKIVTEYYNIHNYFENAKHALIIQKSKNVSGILYYSDLNIELIYEQIPTLTKNQIINKIFSNYDETEKGRIINILTIYYENNCSIKNASNLLNMHPNTLQYHLNKIKNITNLDPRNIKDSMLFQLCIDFYNQIKN